MEINKKLLESLILDKISDKYTASYGDSDYLIYNNKNEIYNVEFRIRIQYLRLLTFEGFSIFSSKKIEKEISNLIIEPLKNYYSNNFYFSSIRFYKTNYNFSQEINSEEQLTEFINEFIKCLEYHEKEIFPKLLDIKFLAEYVGSVPFEHQSEIPIGGSFPVHLFKKLAVLKWGNQTERYFEYKKETKILIEKYAIKKPDKYTHEIKENFEKLVHHLENEPNPFKKNNVC
ncbi:hypothetical protein [Pseudotamlana carrageenivorans]|uniref:Uncharacterized protein n=1 Tax=Pseudotamlana carrageenivorans TaxID=2069432 RepID=A0A2I7SLT5_9FLAO|nr:hypothetical protein [Tamlana carrageenivorans]AUS06866.1 hypothetical protein C1A40_16080 [Tamlana carrageenivorans]